MHLVSLLIPLLAFPWLGRVLKPESFGLLMYMCLFPPLFNLLVEWGFPLGGARKAARQKENPDALRRLLGEIVTAKLLLAFSALFASLALIPLLPFARQWPWAFFWAALAGSAKALSPLWFYQGTGRKLSLYACLDISFSFLALTLIFIFIRHPGQWPLYLIFLACCRLGANLCLTGMLWPSYPFKINIAGALRAIRENTALFAALFFSNVYHYCFQLVLGYFLIASEVGIIVALDKMLRALSGLVNPFTQTIFPEICVLRDSDPRSAWRTLRLSLLLTFLAASAAAALVWLLAGPIIKIALGAAYPQAPQILRVMILAVPAAACAQVLGSQTMAPFGMDSVQARICALVSLASIPFSAALAYYFGMRGAAFAPLFVEFSLFSGYLAALRRERIGLI